MFIIKNSKYTGDYIEESKNFFIFTLFLFYSQLWVTTASSFVCIFPEIYFLPMNKYIFFFLI